MNLGRPERRTHAEGGRSWPVLVWRAAAPLRSVSSASLGGGIGLRSWVVNAQVPSDYGRLDPDAHLSELGTSFALEGSGVGMLTAADVGAVRHGADDGVDVWATVGIGHPTWAAGPDDSWSEGAWVDGAWVGAGPVERAPVGTINVVASLPVALTDAALVNLVVTATEAKAQALLELGIPGTGTASDAVCVLCPAEGAAEPFGGPRSRWGARLARAVHGAVLASGGR